jgi:hypothetical protein
VNHFVAGNRVLVGWKQGVLELHDRSTLADAAALQSIPAWRLFWSEDPPIADEFLRALTASPPIQRLRRIGFLGAIDYLIHSNGRAPHRRRHNRFDHSVNVALLALRYAAQRNLAEEETRVLAAAALLHDVGHGPLSHTLEPTFQKLFRINHHEASQAIIRGSSPLGGAIPEIFASYHVDLDRVLEILSGANRGPHAFLFDSPINFDTIEAIARCCWFSRSPQSVPPTEFVDAIATSNEFPIELGDRFWATKGTIYRTVILSNSGLIADTLAQQYMLQNSMHFRLEDFFLDDLTLRRKHRRLFALFACVRTHSLAKHSLITLNFDEEIEAAVRCFTVNQDAEIHSTEDLSSRYTQDKRKRKLPLKALFKPAMTEKSSCGIKGLELA